jgi:hypothetical protein
MRFVSSALRIARYVLVGACSLAIAGSLTVWGNYLATQGSGTTFSSFVDGLSAHFMQMLPGAGATTGTTWTSATAGNTAQTILPAGNGAPAVTVKLVMTSITGGGAVAFDCAYDSVPNWEASPMPIAQILDPRTLAPLTNPYSLVTGGQAFTILTQGCQQIRMRLSTTIGASGSVTPYITLQSTQPTLAALLNSIAPGPNVIGGVYVSQVTPNSTNHVSVGPYTDTATPITGNNTGTTGSVVGTLAGVSAKTTYICGFSVSAIGGTAAVGPITVAGLITGSMTWELASSASGNQLTVPLTPCVPASATNTSITVTTTADGSASAVAVNSWGFQL